MNMCLPCMQEKADLGDKSCDTLCRKDVQMSLLSLYINGRFIISKALKSFTVFFWNLYPFASLPCRKVHFCFETVDEVHPSTDVLHLFFSLEEGAWLPACKLAKQVCEGATPTSCQRWWNELISGDCTGHWSLSRRALLEPFGAGTSLTLGCIKFEHESTGAEGDKLR